MGSVSNNTKFGHHLLGAEYSGRVLIVREIGSIGTLSDTTRCISITGFVKIRLYYYKKRSPGRTCQSTDSCKHARVLEIRFPENEEGGICV